MAINRDTEAGYSIYNFFGGINQSIDEQVLLPNESPDEQNMDISDGVLSTTKGFKKYIDTKLPAGIKTLMGFYKTNEDGTITSHLLASTETVLYRWNKSKNRWDVLKTGLLSGDFSFINYQHNMDDIIIMGNGYNDVLKWDGVSSQAKNLGGSPPKIKSIGLHYERVWGTGDRRNPNRVYYSDDLNPENWNQEENEGGFIDIPTWDGDVCLAVSTIFDDVVLFKTNSMFRIYGTYPGEYSKQQIFSSAGAIAEKSIVNAVNVAFFLAKDGIYSYNGSQTALVSEKVKNIIKNMNQAYADKAVAVYFDNKYILAIPEGDSQVNNTIIEYDLLRQNIIVKRGIEVSTFLKYNNKLLFANSKGYVYEYNTGYDFDGEMIESYWETPETDLRIPDAIKRSTYFYVTVCGSGILKLDYIFDGVKKTEYIDLPLTPKLIRKRLRHKGRRFKLRFSNVNGSWFVVKGPKLLIDIDFD